RPAHPDPRRRHQRHRLGHRGRDPDGHQRRAHGAHLAGDHPPAVADPARGPHHHARPFAPGGPGHSRRASRAQRAVPAHLPEVRLMGFILGGLTGEEYDRNYSDAQLLRRIVGYFRSHLGKMLFVALLIALNAAALALLPVLTSRGIDGAVARGAQGVEVFNANLPVLLLMVAAAGLAWTFNFLRQAITARVVGDVVLTLREDVFDAAVERDMAFYDDYSTGRVVSRVTSDTQDFSNVVTLTLGLISEVLIVAIVFVILFSINVRLALITTAITPVILGAALAFRWIARRTSRQAKRVKAEVNANIQESITG